MTTDKTKDKHVKIYKNFFGLPPCLPQDYFFVHPDFVQPNFLSMIYEDFTFCPSENMNREQFMTGVVLFLFSSLIIFTHCFLQHELALA